MLVDSFGRPLKSLRVTLTQKCNFNCIYCHREGESKTSEELKPKEVALLVEVMVKLGVKRVKLTGGEPLLYDGLVELVEMLDGTGVEDLSMVTNGSLLSGFAGKLRDKGLKRVNISLPSLKPERFRWITKGDLESVLSGIRAAVDVGFDPVKLNVVVLRGVNDDEVLDYVSFAEKLGVMLQFIELENVSLPPGFYENYHRSLDFVENLLEDRIVSVSYREEVNWRKKLLLDSGVEVHLVSPVDNPNFCKYCYRMRLTSGGFLKPCLMRNDGLVYVRDALEKNDVAEVVKKILEANKHRRPYYL